MITTDSSAPPSDERHGRTGQDLIPEVYAKLKAIAGREVAKAGSPATLSATVLVHELYLKLDAGRDLGFADPLQFLAYAARTMRHIIVDRARAKHTGKRGGGVRHEDIDLVLDQVGSSTAEQTLELDAALAQLEQVDPRAARLVELHYFAGLPLPRIAEMMDVSSRTLNRDWRFARAFLHDALS